MKTIAISIGLWVLSSVSIPAEDGEFRAHEWGTFTTLHWGSHGGYLGWYQPAGPGNPSELPGFVHGSMARKIGMRQTARMETPVIYFYSDKKRSIDLKVDYQEGVTTEYYPDMRGGWNQWKGLEIIPPSEAGGLIDSLPLDPKQPDNHYFEARAVPEAAVVRMRYPVEEGEKPRPDEWDRFLFYRGMGTFTTGLTPKLATGGVLTVTNFDRNLDFKHVWAVKTTGANVRWEKLPLMPKLVKNQYNMIERKMDSLSHSSVDELKASMTGALEDAGLTRSEAAAMVATWDSQWYEEPGQRVFSIVPQTVIDEKLPLTMTPAPRELVRVFVHRQELLSPETLTKIEEVMKPGADQERTREVITGEHLGRFVFGAIESVAADVGRRTQWDYQQRAMTALLPKEEEVAELAQ